MGNNFPAMTRAQSQTATRQSLLLFFCSMLAFGGACFLAVGSSLQLMTENDCKAGIQAACNQLAQ